jgi:hypothetical protein
MITKIVNGERLEFPDGTPQAVINRVIAQKSGGSPDGMATMPNPMEARAQAQAAMRQRESRPGPLLPGIVNEALQGATLGFSDEAIAALRAGLDPRQKKGLSELVTGQPSPGSYEDYLRAEREGMRKYQEENPITSTVANLGGAFAPAVFTGGAGAVPAVSRTVGPRLARMLFGETPSVGRMAATGAGAGAVSAVGTSEKPISEAPGEAALGAVTGGATAGALGLLGQYVAMPAYRQIKRMMGFDDANQMADRLIVDALRKDGVDPNQALARLQGMQRGEATLADVGENTANLLRRASAAPGQARQETQTALSQRAAERAPRISDDLRTLMSASPDFYTDITDLMAKRRTDAQALYGAAWANAPVITPQSAPEIWNMRNLPSFKEAMNQGMRRLRDMGLPLNSPQNIFRGLHETKLALDDRIETEIRQGNRNQAATLLSMKERLLRDMDNASGPYKIARQAYAGDSEMLEAMNQGRNIYTLPEQELRGFINRFSNNPSEYDAFRAGMAQAMLERVRAGGQNADPLQLVFPRGSEQRIRGAFRDDQAFEEFRNRLLEERTMLRTETAGLRRNPMDPTQSDQGSLGPVGTLATGRPVRAAFEAAQNAMPSVAGMAPATAQSAVSKLLTPSAPSTNLGPDPIERTIAGILNSLQQEEAALAGSARRGQTQATVAGGLAAAREPTAQYPEDEGQPPLQQMQRQIPIEQ